MKRFIFVLLFSFVFNVYATTPKKLRIITTFSILQDIVKNVAGDKFEVDSIVPLGTDPHIYEIKPGDIKKIINPGDRDAASIAFLIGLGFEGNLQHTIEHSNFSGPVVIVTKGIKPRVLVEADESAYDPHVWGSVANVMIMVENIRNALKKTDPKNADIYNINAEKYLIQLTQLETYIITSLNKIPKTQRKVVTTHDAFYYYGEAYGVTFLAPIGTSTESEPSPIDLAKIIDVVNQEKITAIFFENIANTKLVKQIAAETGIKIDVSNDVLYADSLSKPEGPASSYIKMMKHTTNLIIGKLAARKLGKTQ